MDNAQCALCKWYGIGQTGLKPGDPLPETDHVCKAFPKGIPFSILRGEFDHTKPYEGDNGVRFEPI